MTTKKASTTKKKTTPDGETEAAVEKPKKKATTVGAAPAKPKRTKTSEEESAAKPRKRSTPRKIDTPPEPTAPPEAGAKAPAKEKPPVDRPTPPVQPGFQEPAPKPPAAKKAAPSAPVAPPKISKPIPPAPSIQPRVPDAAPAARQGGMPATATAPALPSAAPVTAAPERKKIKFNEMMTVKDLADRMNVKVPDVIKKLLTLGTPASINQRLERDTAALVADGFGFDLDFESIYQDVDAKELAKSDPEAVPRSPVVTVMGHVDHGKTSLLDAIRSARVVEKEAGGITQHIGAYQVQSVKGSITFLDTPGHEAFTAMRARGAMATDLVVLVVAADDSVMPQTIEAINHAKAANVPIVVAINKVDLPTANVQKVKQELANYDLVAEDWGGKTVMVEVSAKTKQNLDKLIEMILLEAELLELRANPKKPARGVVLEARLDPKRGIVATILVQSGMLRVGDIVVCGLSSGRVRAMMNDSLKPVSEAMPSMPVSLLGLNQVPQVGDQLAAVPGEREARDIIERRKEVLQGAAAAKGPAHLSLESLHARISEGKIQELPIILKADTQGSMQAIQDSLGKISGTSIKLRWIHSGIGNINESDILLAEASDAIVFGFHVKVEGSAEAEAKRSGVDIRTYQIIYEMLADVRAAMEGLLKPEEREVVKARAQVKDVFASSRLGMVAGCIVLEGKLTRGGKARLLRQNAVVAAGSISSLRRFKEDVREVDKGYECGVSLEGVKSYAKGDVIEMYVIEKHTRRLQA